MITRTYKTKNECAHCWLTEDWDFLDSTLITENDDWYERWSFRCANDSDNYECYDEDEPDGALVLCGEPMWNTWFEPDRWVLEFIEAHEEEVAALGFTLIYHDEYLWGVGIDGAGFDFYESFWMPLYDLVGIHWHDED